MWPRLAGEAEADVEPQDPERRIAELERQLAEAQAAARQEELLGGSADSGEAMQSSAAPYETQLAPAPRKVPVPFLFAEMLPFRWWYVWVLFHGRGRADRIVDSDACGVRGSRDP